MSLHARDANCFGFANGVPAFGYSALEVKAGVGPAALGDVNYRIVFAPQPVGTFNPVVSLGGGFYDFAPFETFMATASCDGTLREGSGYPTGTEGFAQTTQTGLLSTGVPSGCPVEKDADCFPAEKVQFKATGN